MIFNILISYDIGKGQKFYVTLTMQTIIIMIDLDRFEY